MGEQYPSILSTPQLFLELYSSTRLGLTCSNCSAVHFSRASALCMLCSCSRMPVPGAGAQKPILLCLIAACACSGAVDPIRCGFVSVHCRESAYCWYILWKLDANMLPSFFVRPRQLGNAIGRAVYSQLDVLAMNPMAMPVGTSEVSPQSCC